jgi:tetratricopeptide (TPR) repeat protein
LSKIKGACWANKGDHIQSLEYYQKCFEMRRRLYGEDALHSEIAHVLNNIGAEYSKQKGELSMKEAISYCERALEMQTKLYEKPDGKHPDLIETLENLSAYYSTVLDEEKSLKYARQAYGMQTHLFPNVDHLGTARLLLRIGKSYANLAVKAKESDDKQLYIDYVGTSINEIFKANEMQRRIFYDRAHPDFAETLQSLGESYKKKN